MNIAKQEVSDLLKSLLDSCTLEDIQYHLYVLEKIQKGIQRSEKERTIEHNEVERITETYLNYFSFPKKSIRDASHIAYAVFYKMDFLLTWNYRHLANAEMRSMLHRINNKLGYETPDVCTPLELVPPDIKLKKRRK